VSGESSRILREGDDWHVLHGERRERRLERVFASEDVAYDETHRAGPVLVDATTGHGRGEISYPEPVTGHPRPLGDRTGLTGGDVSLSRWGLE
jgi:hypothetical protein